MRPRPVVGEATVPDAVRRLQDAFDYPDRESPAQLVPILPTLGSGGGGAPSVVVAAFDASDFEKDRADFQCIGTNDELVIQAAIDAMDLAYNATLNQGYRVLLSAGVFNLDASVAGGAIQLGVNGGTLQGMGNEATLLNAQSTSPTGNDEPLIEALGSRVIVRDLSCQGGATNRLTGIRLSGYDTRVINCLLSTNGYGVSAEDDVAVITGCAFEGDRGVRVTSSATNILVIANYIGASWHGVEIDTASRILIMNNMIEQTARHGISLNDVTDSLIEANLIYRPGGATDNTYDGIILAGNSDRNDIWDNKIIGKSAANQPRYGINISAAACDDNSYLGNRTGPAANYGTGAYNDAGTGTVNTWPGAAAPQGDNLL